jgi:DNA-binding beta-propeller fold protein YncE
VFSVADGSRLRVVGGGGSGPLQFDAPRQVWVASDDHVFVADYGNHRVQVLTPTLDFHAFVGVGQLDRPAGVCADDDVVIATQWARNSVVVFNRGDGAVLREIGAAGVGRVQLRTPLGLCFMSNHRHVAVADCDNHRVCVFGVNGEFIRDVGAHKLRFPQGVVCSAADELVVADWQKNRLAMFTANGMLLKTVGAAAFTGVVMHGGTVFAQDAAAQRCVVFE